MRFIQTDSTDLVAGVVAGLIQAHLDSGKRVLWLLSGGSSITVAVTAWRLLEASGDQLVIGQIDERYGPVSHADSNWYRLEQAGFSPRSDEQVLPILTGTSLEETAAHYDQTLAEELKRADVRIGLFGIGSDGHTAGILPHSPAVESPALVSAYAGPDFERITVTTEVLAQLDEAVAVANGTAKRDQLARLKTTAPGDEQPAQLLKRARHAIVFSDVIL